MRHPSFLYGTAWKEDQTARLTRLALEQGFRGIDTANQRKHYHEAGVGEAIAGAIRDGLVTRDQLFVQTKFTHVGGQDDRLPYDPTARPGAQVQQSFASSLHHLELDFLDSYMLHGPTYREGWSPEDLEIWAAMEDLHAAGKTRFLGVSNVSQRQLEELVLRSRQAPHFVQNRCYARTRWDAGVRGVCRANGLVYQGFSLLTANAREIAAPAIQGLAARLGRTPAQVVFRFAQQVGMLPLTGTSDAPHMDEDLQSGDFDLTGPDLEIVENASG